MLGSEIFQNKSKLIDRRMFILSIAKIGVFIALVSRLFYLQISENIKYRSLLIKIDLGSGNLLLKEEFLKIFLEKKLQVTLKYFNFT